MLNGAVAQESGRDYFRESYLGSSTIEIYQDPKIKENSDSEFNETEHK